MRMVRPARTGYRSSARSTLKGNPIKIDGHFPAVGDKAPAFSLVAKDLSDATLANFSGKRKVLNIFRAWIRQPARCPCVISTKPPVR
jgi:hypothetical protein